MKKAIIAKNITKKYKLYNDTKERLLDLVTSKEYGDDFYALANIGFEADKGEVIGFIGVNGSGKSTFSNIIAGIVPETSGSVEVDGQVSLIAVAAGLKGDLSGRDNIELKLLMLGFNKDEIKELEPEIIEFSELGKFIDQPVKSYSSGMRSRLGFAISVTVNPDILIIDEALSVGDKAFAEKSLNKMLEFKERGKTMIFVSHSIGQMKRFCEKVLWLEFGMVREFGTVEDVIPKYERFLNKWQKYSKDQREEYRKNALEYQQAILNNPTAEYTMPETFIDEPISKSNKYKVTPVSRLGQIKQETCLIFEDFMVTESKSDTKEYIDEVYFIKRRADHLDKSFYLLSDQPSAIDGVIGWVKASDVHNYIHVPIDIDRKTFCFMGTGIAYDKAWGGKRNIVYPSLKSFEGKVFLVNQTDQVGRNIWYRGLIEEKQVWIHGNHLTDDVTHIH